MEEIKKPNRNMALGIVGAFIGGLVGTLPWIICYVYANMMYSILAVFIPICAFKGYEIFKGSINKIVPIIIGVVSLVAISLATLIIIPNLLVLKEYGKMSFEMVKLLYQFEEFKSAIIHDYIFSLLFTVLGAGGIIMNIKRSIDAGDEKVSFSNPFYGPSNEDIDSVKEVFKTKQAMSKDHTITKEELMSEIAGKENVLNFLIARGIVVRKKNTYYFNEENERNPIKRALKITGITFGIVILVIFIIAIIFA